MFEKHRQDSDLLSWRIFIYWISLEMEIPILL